MATTVKGFIGTSMVDLASGVAGERITLRKTASGPALGILMHRARRVVHSFERLRDLDGD